jgi:N-methylhydantoinase A/acetophenone carboxylase
MDVVQYYETTKYLLFKQPAGLGGAGTGEFFSDYEKFNEVVRDLQRLAIRDLQGQGIPLESAGFSLELEMRYGGQLNMTRVPSPRIFIKDPSDVKAIYENFEREFIKAYSALSVFPEGGVDISSFVLRSIFVSPKLTIPKYPLRSTKAPADAFRGKRDAFWQELGGFKPTSTYESSRLEPGNRLEGPAIIEAVDTTIVLPPGRTYTVNEYLSGIIT